MVLVLKKGASKKEIEEVNKNLYAGSLPKKLNAKKYCGIIKLNGDALDIQKSLRNEWE